MPTRKRSDPLSKPAVRRVQNAALGGRDRRRSLIRVAALVRTCIHGRHYIVVGVTRRDIVIGKGGRSIQGSVDDGVRPARGVAAIDVIADRIGRAIPGQIDRMWWRSSARPVQCYDCRRVRGVARERQGPGSRSARLGRERDREGSWTASSDRYGQRDPGQREFAVRDACRCDRDRGTGYSQGCR